MEITKIIEGITWKKIKKLECLYEEAIVYTSLYYSTEDEDKRKTFVSHFRSPIFDETNIKIFKKPYISLKAYNKKGPTTDEHCNGRTNMAKAIFEKIHNGEINNFDEFLQFLLDYCYTIKILKEENTKVKIYSQQNKDKNFIEAYRDLGIVLCDLNGNVVEEPNLLIMNASKT